MAEYDPNKKYFLAVLIEKNGEQEYSHDVIIQAEDENAALIRAERLAAEWYDSEYERDGDWVMFDMGVAVRVECIMTITPMEYFERKILH